MPKFSNQYVIMLDPWVDAMTQHWPITFANKDIKKVRAQATFEGNPEPILKDDLKPELIEGTSLINLETGDLVRGAIYFLRFAK